VDVLEWGKTYHQVGENRVRMQRAQEARKEIVDGINLEVKSAFLETGETYENIGVARDAISQAEENFRIYKERFDQQWQPPPMCSTPRPCSPRPV